MIRISTYMANHNLIAYEETKEPGISLFVSIVKDEALDILSSMVPKNKRQYLHGAIVIQADQKMLNTFYDWDDLDLLWTGFLDMVLEYVGNGKFGSTQLSNNGIEWSIRSVQAKPKNFILFHSKRPNTFYDGKIDTPYSVDTKAHIVEMDFLRESVSSAEDFLNLREKNARTESLGEFKAKILRLKSFVFN